MTATQEPFSLTQEVVEHAASPPVSQICGNCKHFVPYRDQQTQRVHPSKKGRCGWSPNIKWPMAYRRCGYGSHEQDPLVFPVGVWKYTNAKTCACFSPND